MEKSEQVHGEKPERGEGDLILRFMGEKLGAVNLLELWLIDHDGTHITSDQCPDLLLYALCFSEKAFVNTQRFEAPFSLSDIVNLRAAIRYRSLRQVIRICSYISTLCLD
jgi:hypothetical protein